MRLTPPKNITWWIALILGALGFLGYTGTIPALSPFAFFLVLAGLSYCSWHVSLGTFNGLVSIALGLKNRSGRPRVCDFVRGRLGSKNLSKGKGYIPYDAYWG
jgi:hypothetical protein